MGRDSIYKGTYINGIKEGNGEIGFNDGKQLIINFIHDKPCGKGILIDENNNIIEAEFENGKIKNSNINFNFYE